MPFKLCLEFERKKEEKKEEEKVDIVSNIIGFLSYRENFEDLPDLYKDDLIKGLYMLGMVDKGYVLQGRSEEIKTKLKNSVIFGLNTVGYVVELKEEEAKYAGKIGMSPLTAKIYGKKVKVNDVLILDVIPEKDLKNDFNTLRMYVDDAIIVLGEKARKAKEKKVKAEIIVLPAE